MCRGSFGVVQSVARKRLLGRGIIRNIAHSSEFSHKLAREGLREVAESSETLQIVANPLPRASPVGCALGANIS